MRFFASFLLFLTLILFCEPCFISARTRSHPYLPSRHSSHSSSSVDSLGGSQSLSYRTSLSDNFHIFHQRVLDQNLRGFRCVRDSAAADEFPEAGAHEVFLFLRTPGQPLYSPGFSGSVIPAGSVILLDADNDGCFAPGEDNVAPGPRGQLIHIPLYKRLLAPLYLDPTESDTWIRAMVVDSSAFEAFDDAEIDFDTENIMKTPLYDTPYQFRYVGQIQEQEQVINEQNEEQYSQDGIHGDSLVVEDSEESWTDSGRDDEQRQLDSLPSDGELNTAASSDDFSAQMAANQRVVSETNNVAPNTRQKTNNNKKAPSNTRPTIVNNRQPLPPPIVLRRDQNQNGGVDGARERDSFPTLGHIGPLKPRQTGMSLPLSTTINRMPTIPAPLSVLSDREVQKLQDEFWKKAERELTGPKNNIKVHSKCKVDRMPGFCVAEPACNQVAGIGLFELPNQGTPICSVRRREQQTMMRLTQRIVCCTAMQFLNTQVGQGIGLPAWVTANTRVEDDANAGTVNHNPSLISTAPRPGTRFTISTDGKDMFRAASGKTPAEAPKAAEKSKEDQRKEYYSGGSPLKFDFVVDDNRETDVTRIGGSFGWNRLTAFDTALTQDVIFWEGPAPLNPFKVTCNMCSIWIEAGVRLKGRWGRLVKSQRDYEITLYWGGGISLNPQIGLASMNNAAGSRRWGPPEGKAALSPDFPILKSLLAAPVPTWVSVSGGVIANAWAESAAFAGFRTGISFSGKYSMTWSVVDGGAFTRIPERDENFLKFSVQPIHAVVSGRLAAAAGVGFKISVTVDLVISLDVSVTIGPTISLTYDALRPLPACRAQMPSANTRLFIRPDLQVSVAPRFIKKNIKVFAMPVIPIGKPFVDKCFKFASLDKTEIVEQARTYSGLSADELDQMHSESNTISQEVRDVLKHHPNLNVSKRVSIGQLIHTPIESDPNVRIHSMKNGVQVTTIDPAICEEKGAKLIKPISGGIQDKLSVALDSCSSPDTDAAIDEQFRFSPNCFGMRELRENITDKLRFRLLRFEFTAREAGFYTMDVVDIAPELTAFVEFKHSAICGPILGCHRDSVRSSAADTPQIVLKAGEKVYLTVGVANLAVVGNSQISCGAASLQITGQPIEVKASAQDSTPVRPAYESEFFDI